MENNSPDFGPTEDIHANVMAFLWGPVINVSIILAVYSYRQYAIILHGLISFFVGLFSLIISLAILATTGMIDMIPDDPGNVLYNHYRVGLAAMLCIISQILLGIMIRLFNICQFRSIVILRIRMIHKVSGYLMVILCKSNYYLIFWLNDQTESFWGFLAMDIVCVILIVLRKTLFPKLEHHPSPNISQVDCPKVRSLKDLDQSKDYVIWANAIYNIQTLRINHPIGFEVIQSVKNRDIDRYLYGMYSSESLPIIPKHSHSFRAIKLLGDPVAKLQIQPTVFLKHGKSEITVKAMALSCVSKEGDLYLLRLTSVDSIEFQIQGYNSLDQLGRFRALTLGNSVTRLYTNVLFARKENIKLMEQLFRRNINYRQINLLASSQILNTQKSMSEQPVLQKNVDQKQAIPLIFKEYLNGRMTNILVNEILNRKNPNLVLSIEQGQGLLLQSLVPGKVLIFVGGTGILPFSDLIDLLFKDEYVQQYPQYAEQFAVNNPVLLKSFLPKIIFHLYASFHSLTDLHPITLNQLSYLAKCSKRLEVSLKLKVLINQIMNQLGFTQAKGRFESILEGQIKQSKEISKVWVCGPPKMNETLSLVLRQHYDPEKYLIL